MFEPTFECHKIGFAWFHSFCPDKTCFFRFKPFLSGCRKKLPIVGHQSVRCAAAFGRAKEECEDMEKLLMKSSRRRRLVRQESAAAVDREAQSKRIEEELQTRTNELLAEKQVRLSTGRPLVCLIVCPLVSPID